MGWLTEVARMIPATVSEGTRSEAEKRLFAVIRDGLSDEWTAIHSLGMTVHRKKPWAEIDFVLIGPEGLFCMEVKGGLVSRDSGQWYTTPLHGPDSGIPQTLKESPFEQVGSASASLFTQLERRFHGARDHLMCCYCVATPDSEWTVAGVDFDPVLVYDLPDTLLPFERFIERVSAYWRDQSSARWRREPSPLSGKDRSELIKTLAGDFNLAPSLRVVADRADAELVRLTDEQAEMFARLDGTPQVIARGGAGTGKTFLAVAEARRLATSGGTPLLVCFSRNLALHLQNLLSDEPLITVTTLHSLMRKIVSDAGRLGDVPDAEDSDVLEVFLPELTTEILLDGESDRRYSALIVDEGQDLLAPNYLDVFDLLLSGGLVGGTWRWFFDPNQDIFSGLGDLGISALRSFGPAVWRLTMNCRNTGPIADRVAMLSGIDRGPVLSADGPPVDILWWDQQQSQSRAVSEAIYHLVHEGIRPERIVVLSPRRYDKSCVADGLVGRKLDVVDLSRGGVDRLHAGAVGFSTISSFKGLESDVVVLVDIVDLTASECLSQVYVGSSRARLKLVVALESGLSTRMSELAEEFGSRLRQSS